MEKKRTYSLTLKKKKNQKNKDLCPVCDTNLYYDDQITQRVGILGDDDYTVEGWMCPECRSRFDIDNNLTYINTSNNQPGKA